MGQRLRLIVENGRFRVLNPVELREGEVLQVEVLSRTPPASTRVALNGDHQQNSGAEHPSMDAEARAREFQAALKDAQEEFARLPAEVQRELITAWEGPEAAAALDKPAA